MSVIYQTTKWLLIIAAFVNTISLGLIGAMHIISVLEDPGNHFFILTTYSAFVQILVLGVFLIIFLFKKPPKNIIYLYLYNLVLVIIFMQLDRFLF